jgi:hypothetical protein
VARLDDTGKAPAGQLLLKVLQQQQRDENQSSLLSDDFKVKPYELQQLYSAMSLKLHPAGREQHHHHWARALCRLSSVLFLVSVLMLWGSLSISRGSQKLTAQHSYERSLLLPGFQQLSTQLEHRRLGSRLSEHTEFSSESAQAAAGLQEQPQQQLVGQPLVSDVPGYPGPPYILPKLIHQTVKDKSSMSCEVQESIQSWIDMNPGYTHILYDDTDLLDFVKEHYPDLVGIYQGLPTNIERTDTWRYLVLHKLGGVYADSDVKCMQPISTWNQERSFDAALMVGIAKRNMKTGNTKEFNQFVIAAMPGHPVLATMPMVIAGNLAYTYLKDLPRKGQGKAADEAILMRTGPKAFTSALKAYAHRVGAKWPVNSTQADLDGGVLFGTVRAMPKFVLGTGWDTLDHNMTCEEVKQSIRPEALICHQFFGTWKSRPEKQLQARQFTYGDCNRPDGEQQLPGSDTNSVIDHAQDDADAAAAAPVSTGPTAEAAAAGARDAEQEAEQSGAQSGLQTAAQAKLQDESQAEAAGVQDALQDAEPDMGAAAGSRLLKPPAAPSADGEAQAVDGANPGTAAADSASAAAADGADADASGAAAGNDVMMTTAVPDDDANSDAAVSSIDAADNNTISQGPEVVTYTTADEQENAGGVADSAAQLPEHQPEQQPLPQDRQLSEQQLQPQQQQQLQALPRRTLVNLAR